MLKKTIATPIIVLFLSAFAFGFQLPSDWVSFKSAEGRFSVGMPKTPTPAVKDVDSALGKLQLYSFTASSSTTFYLACYGDYPTEPGSDRQTVVLDLVRDGVVKGIEGEFIAEKVISIDGHPGREFTAQKALDGVENIFTWRVYLVGRRLYQVAAVTAASSANSPEIQKFLNSFRLME